MSRSGFVVALFRLLVAVGVLACLTGVAGHSHAALAGESPAVGHAAAMQQAPVESPAPAVPDHHGGADSHAHGCMTAMPGPDGTTAVPAPSAVEVPAPLPSCGAALLAGTAPPPRPPSDLNVLCVWRT